MVKEKEFPLAMNDIGEPSEMSQIKEITNTESKSPIVEVNQPLESQDPLEIRNPSSVTVI